MKQRIFFFALLFCAATALSLWIQSTYDVPENLILTSSSAVSGESYSAECHSVSDGTAVIDRPDGILKMLVWNIYKQNKAGSLSLLSELSQNRQLVMLQEAKMDPSFWANYPFKKHWHFYHVDAWEYHQERNGVLTAASILPNAICGFSQAEPWLRLPKSSLLTYYSLSNGTQLAVANIHAINFSLGLDDYQKQISQLTTTLLSHSGPIILAGDFNSWSDERIEFLDKITKTLNLQEASYQNDKLRKRFITGQPLDHIFYRGLKEISADVITTDKSDHNPIVASFKIIEPQ